MTQAFDTYCGLTCATCTFKDECNCGGCIATKGKPFHGKCDIAECAKQKQVDFCGHCPSFPCDVLTSYSYDPEHGDQGARIKHIREILASEKE